MDNIVKLLKVIGNGPFSSRDFTETEAVEVIERIIKKEFSQSQLGALFLVMRRKSESIDETRGFLKGIYNNYPIKNSNPDYLMIGNSMSGKVRTISLTLIASIIISTMGYGVTYGFCNGLGPRYGISDFSTLDGMSGQEIFKVFKKPLIWDLEEVYPFTGFVKQARNDIGLRSFFHNVEKYLNPFGAGHILLTVHHLTYVDAMKVMITENFKSGMIINGAEGTADLNLKKETAYIRFKEGKVEEGSFKSFKDKVLELEVSPNTVLNTVNFFNKALKNKDSLEREIIIYQCSILLFALGKGNTVEESFSEVENFLNKF